MNATNEIVECACGLKGPRAELAKHMHNQRWWRMPFWFTHPLSKQRHPPLHFMLVSPRDGER